ncbi:MAG: hypothetical protein CL681_06525 [Blastopirellula sp.]|nr:hypothetical protein [Blastopirellula sp.]
MLQLSPARLRQANMRDRQMKCLWALAETSHHLQQYQPAMEYWDQAIEFCTEPKLRAFLTRQRQLTRNKLSPSQP